MLTRRHLLGQFVALSSAMLTAPSLFAQAPKDATKAPPKLPIFEPRFVEDRAEQLARAPFEAAVSPLPEPFQRLDFDRYRSLRFKPEKAFLGKDTNGYRLHLFHRGFLYERPVVINLIRDGIATLIPYSNALFDYGALSSEKVTEKLLEKPLPVDTHFAGFRLHFPLNQANVFDELISFLGSSYFRVLGRGQQYGLSARSLSLHAGGAEEFPFFREFWLEPSTPESLTVHALLDSPSVAGAYRFTVYPSTQSVVDVSATLYPRVPLTGVGLAPMSSMFFTGENDRRFFNDFRTELHDSDGLLMHRGTGEWLWRPLRNPTTQKISAFTDSNPRGFGLMQRDRVFEHYQDLDLAYELRPSYWVEPRGTWGEGHVELIEMPTTDETNDNIAALWRPKNVPQPLQPFRFQYTLTSKLSDTDLHPGARVLNTYFAAPKALGSNEEAPANVRRIILDFTGGDLAFYLSDPAQVVLLPSVSRGIIRRATLTPNRKINGFRAMLDVEVVANETTDVRAFLKAGSKTLSETWTMPLEG
jgi:periplasmic glucans biosynthesis protein